MNRQTSQRYHRPYRPLPIALANAAWRGIERLGGRVDLSPPRLLAAARRSEKLEDFGDNGFLEGLHVLVDSIEREAQLTPVGRFITRTRLVNTLANRLRAQELLRQHPDIADMALPPVILITGLQRTGTTLLHRLLASDPSNRALLSWEAINPVPPVNGHTRDPRPAFARTSQRALSFLAPDFFAIHPVEADAPEEDVLLLDYAFLSTVPESTLHVPTYARWVEEQDHRPAYRYMAALMRILQWQHPGNRWVLKSPHHLEFLDALHEVFPDVTVVQTHRDPAVTVPSFSSMISHGRGVFSDRIDPREIGALLLRKTARMVRHGLETRRRIGTDSFLDIFYDDLLRDPMGEVTRVYARCGLTVANEVRASMQHILATHVQYRYGRHRYDLTDFGLTRDDIAEAFADYYRTFPATTVRAA